MTSVYVSCHDPMFHIILAKLQQNQVAFYCFGAGASRATVRQEILFCLTLLSTRGIQFQLTKNNRGLPLAIQTCTLLIYAADTCK